MSHWSTADIPLQTNRVAIITGANSGIGLETAKALAVKGADVVMACRNLHKADLAADGIRAEVPGAKLTVMKLDLADLKSVHAFAEAFSNEFDKLELLINNAGVMVPPFSKTEDGFELQFGANHLGHFALTGLLMPHIRTTPGARVVSVSSSAHRMGKLEFDNLQAEKGYKAWAAYGQSKLANLLFMRQLNVYFTQEKIDALAAAAHPGWTGTNLQSNAGAFRFLNPIVGQKPVMGALPTLYAATAPDVRPNDYYGPDGFQEMRGHPEKVSMTQDAQNMASAEKLWNVSEKLTGVHYGTENAVSV